MQAICTLDQYEAELSKIREEEVFRDAFFHDTSRALFRGEEDFSWDLKPKISRYGKSEEELKKIEEKLVSEFIERMKDEGLSKHLQSNFLPLKSHEKWLQQMQAQHLGLATRLLDWTLEPYVALFFATKGHFDKDGRLSIIFPERKWSLSDNGLSSYAETSPFDVENSFCLNPSFFADGGTEVKFAERFRRRQQGRFFVQPLSKSLICLRDQPEFNPHIYSICIPNNCKKELLRDLENRHGLTEDWVFMKQEIGATSDKIKSIVDSLHVKYGLT